MVARKYLAFGEARYHGSPTPPLHTLQAAAQLSARGKPGNLVPYRNSGSQSKGVDFGRHSIHYGMRGALETSE